MQLALPLSSFGLLDPNAHEIVFRYHAPPYAILTFDTGEPEWDYLGDGPGLGAWDEAPEAEPPLDVAAGFTLHLSDVFISSAGEGTPPPRKRSHLLRSRTL